MSTSVPLTRSSPASDLIELSLIFKIQSDIALTIIVETSLIEQSFVDHHGSSLKVVGIGSGMSRIVMDIDGR